MGLLKWTLLSGVCRLSLVLFMFGLDLAVDLLDLLILVDIWVLMLFISCLIWASIEALVFSGGSMYGMLTMLLFLMQHSKFFL